MIRLPLKISERLLRWLGVRPRFLAVELQEAPYPEQMDPGLLYIERPLELRYAVLLCPGCSRRVGVPLEIIQPRWSSKIDMFSRPTLNPAIRHEYGCLSEFSIRRGKLHWALGSKPSGTSSQGEAQEHTEPR